jgi:hypothetical protein
MPVGLELLGRPLDDVRLVALGYAFEQSTNHRRSPTLTPSLEGGSISRPITFEVIATGAELIPGIQSPPTARARFTFDPMRNSLAYSVEVSGVPAERVYAVTLQRAEPGQNGPVVYRLAGPGSAAARGTLDLSGTDREALLKGDLYLEVYTQDYPRGAARRQLLLPNAALRADENRCRGAHLKASAGCSKASQ